MNTSGPVGLARASLRRITRIATVIAPPVLRIALALPFLRSGLTRWDGFLTLSAGAAYLFEEQFKLHVFGRLYDLPQPLMTAYVVGVAEIVLPVLLLAGLGTRIAALGLLTMTGVIQLVVPDGWANFHLYWAAIALGILALGPGDLSSDRLLERLRLDGVANSGESSRMRGQSTILTDVSG